MNTFSELGLSGRALSSLQEAGFSSPTEIQTKTIGLIGKRHDVVASAQTGSGKTVAFALPILDLLGARQAKTRALILVPTRELALQVKEDFDRFGKGSTLRTVLLYGGTGYDKQVNALRGGADVIVATPGRLLDCVTRRFADLSALQILVLDEADRLLDMGFMPQIRKVVSHVPRDRQTLMFSATIDARMHSLASEFLRDPIIVKANAERVEPISIDQKFHYIDDFDKDALLLKLLKESQMDSVLVFTSTRRKATWVADRLRDAKVSAQEIHGDISQNQRERTLTQYRNGAFPVLVATDVAARGLDIPSITHVINYDLPTSAADYVHRIGRTGRAGRTGVAHSFVSWEQRYLVPDIEKVICHQLGGAPLARPAVKRMPARRGRRLI